MFNFKFIVLLLLISSLSILKCNGSIESDKTYDLCSVPKIENGDFDFPIGKQPYHPRNPPPNFPVIAFYNNKKYVLNTTYSVVYCINGIFEKDLPKCVLACPPIISTSIDVQCNLNGIERDCSKNVPEGTVATMKCKESFVGLIPGPSTVTCLDGSWNNPQKECIRPAIYTKCQLAEALLKQGIPRNQLEIWVCIAKDRSGGNTALYSEYDEYYGIFKIYGTYWCNVGSAGGGCNMDCEKFLDDDITDDIECAKIIYNTQGLGAFDGICSETNLNLSECGF